ncbi:hypothetical protein XO10_01135 [Marinitoga sp. 1135]|nr:hypothetical protein [Marinitoga sp. 1135]
MNFIGLKQMKLYCEHDELSYNNLQNQIIKTTLYYLLKNKKITNNIKDEIEQIYIYFNNVDLIRLDSLKFNNILFHRNNNYYIFIIKICELLYNNYLFSTSCNNKNFMNIFDDEEKMHVIFEKFVRNFYKITVSDLYNVKIEYIKWKWSSNVLEGKLINIPTMKTDISLISKSKKIIIDTKYYKNALQKNYDREKFISSNLYQISSYLENTNPKDNQELVGILLYPERDNQIDFCAKSDKYKICIKTINLNQHWSKIEERLKNIIN